MDLRDKLLASGVEVVEDSSPERYTAAMKADIARLGKVIKESGIKADQ